MKMSSTKPNVLFLECGSSGQGGSFISLKDHVALLRKNFNKVVIVIVTDSKYQNEYEALGCKVIKLFHPIYSPKSIFKRSYNLFFSLARRVNDTFSFVVQYLYEYFFSKKLASIIQDHNIVLLHLNDQPMRNFSGFVAAKKMNLAVISHIRTLCVYGFNRKFIAYLNKLNAHYIAISNAVKLAWIECGLQPDLIEVVYNPVTVTEVPNLKCRQNIIFVGRLIQLKQVDLLIRAFHKISDVIEINLLIVGDGPLLEELKNISSDLGLDGRVLFLGYKKQVHSYIREAKVLVLPSSSEGFGRVIVEAMKLKVAVIGNAQGGIAELITHGETGLLFQYNCVESLSGRLLALYQDDDLYNRLVQNAYNYAALTFSEKQYIHVLAAHYKDSVLTKRRVSI